jgi:hypothetical protein
MEIVTEKEYRSQLRSLETQGDRLLSRYEAQRHGYAFVDLSRVEIEPSAIGLLDPSLGRSFHVLPLKVDGINAWVCMELPPSPKLVERLRIETGMNVIPVGTLPEALSLSVRYYYPLAA